MQHPNLLRHHRKQWALKQRHIAHLTGFKSRTTIAELEDGHKFTGLEQALAFAFLFEVDLADLFPKIARDVEDLVIRRALVLDDEIRAHTDPSAERIREFLQNLISRAGTEPML